MIIIILLPVSTLWSRTNGELNYPGPPHRIAGADEAAER